MTAIMTPLAEKLPKAQLLPTPASDGTGADLPAEDETFYIRATPAQVRFWWVDQLRRKASTLNVALAWKVSGPLDTARVAETFAALIQRHETLRTIFEASDGEIWQVIHPTMQIDLPVDDISHLPAGERESELQRLMHREALIAMDMSKGPLLAARILRLGPEEFVLLVTLHRSVGDGWSNGIVLRDFAAIYDGLERKQPAALPEIALQYGDYAHWLEEWRKGPGFEASLNYWRETLGGNFATLKFHHDFPEGEKESEGRIESLLVSPEVAEQVRQYSSSHDLTPYMIYLSVFALTASRVTHQPDIVIGTPCANRRPGTEETIGAFSNAQTVRFNLNEGTPLAEVLAWARTSALDAMKHQDLPFEDIYEDDFFSGDKNQIPMQLYFVFQKAFMQAQQTQSLRIAPLRSISPGAAFELSLSVVERAEGPRLQLEYDTAEFRAETIEGILRLYVEILALVVADADRAISSLPRVAIAADGPADGKPETPKSVAPKSNAGSAGPRDVLEEQVAAVWEAALGVRNLSADVNFFEVGGTSLAAMRVITRLNKMFSLNFGVATILIGNTVEKLATLIRNRIAVNTTSALVRMQSGGSGAPLFILHGAGGNVVGFYQLAMLLGSRRPIFAIQAQSLLRGSNALLRLEDQAAFYLAEIRKCQPKGPYNFVGYSFGGVLALEMVRQLHAAGEKMSFFGMFDTERPGCFADLHRNDSREEKLNRKFVKFRYYGTSLSFAEQIEFLRGKVMKLARRGFYKNLARLGIRSVPEWLKHTEDINMAAARNYHLRSCPARMCLFRAEVQFNEGLPPDLGWNQVMERGVEIITLPGEHLLMFRDPNVRELAKRMREVLDRETPVGEPGPPITTSQAGA